MRHPLGFIRLPAGAFVQVGSRVREDGRILALMRPSWDPDDGLLYVEDPMDQPLFVELVRREPMQLPSGSSIFHVQQDLGL